VIRVTAPPVDGRDKVVRVDGVDSAALRAALGL
jgi:hypothetical protein